ncbi:MAG: tRNA epoxyqueuosine(34) reductase QueG [Xanthomonadales bacterium]|nr:tRNA epoxyqueuosine(34) reductase QueG [Xanthomonadales bacterium]
MLEVPTIYKTDQTTDMLKLAAQIKVWAQEFGFQQSGISDTQLDQHEKWLFEWLEQGMHGDMEWMLRHGTKRSRPAELVADTQRVISVRMDYLPEAAGDVIKMLQQPSIGIISRYALGRDYHKIMRKRLQKLADKITAVVGKFGYRVFVDSAPVLEKALAEKAGLGWVGKHSNVINRSAGSWFFLGEIYTDLPLPADTAASEHCGDCVRCIDICPTAAIIAPYKVDARRCISYLTIENKGPIPLEFRQAIGNRIYGCDDCQATCPWNRFAQTTAEADFNSRHPLDAPALSELLSWDEAEFLLRMSGSAIRRIGYERWQRNLAVASGNALRAAQTSIEEKQHIQVALNASRSNASPMVCEHIDWAQSQMQPA